MRIIRTAEQYKKSNNDKTFAKKEADRCPCCNETSIGYTYMNEELRIAYGTLNWIECECYSCGTRWATSEWIDY